MFFIKKTFKNHFVGSLGLGASTFWLPQPNPPNSKGDTSDTTPPDTTPLKIIEYSENPSSSDLCLFSAYSGVFVCCKNKEAYSDLISI